MKVVLRRLLLLVIIALALGGAHPGPAQAEPASALSEGAPKLLGKSLGKESYVEVEVKKLAHPKVVWINWDYLEEHDIVMQSEQELIDAFGWAVPSVSDPPGTFLDETRKFWADRYGGTGIGFNWGSGRAASAGEVQIKGIGITPLVGEGQTYDHAHGRASLEEGIREAIWGEVNQELPYGANRVIAILDPGTFTQWPDGGREHDALIIREDPKRPAHYMKAPFGRGQRMLSTEKLRVMEATSHIEQALPVPESARGLSRTQRIGEGLRAFARCMAEQYASAFARQLYHGATSPSNFEIDCRFIDYGTMTAQPGFGKVQVLDHVAPAGDTREIKETLIGSFLDELRGNLGATVLFKLPSKSSLYKEFDQAYEATLAEELLKLTGAPPALVAKLADSPEGKELGVRLKAVATAGATPVNVDRSMPKKVSTYDLPKILTDLSSESSASAESLKPVLAADIPDERLRSELATEYHAFLAKVYEQASHDGISSGALRAYIHENAKLRNRIRTELFRDHLQRTDKELIEAYEHTGDRSGIWALIDNTVRSARRSYPSDDPYRLVLRRERFPRQDTHVDLVFDAHRSELELVVDSPIEKDGMVHFFQHKIPSEQAGSSVLRYSTDHWGSAHEARPERVGDRLVFRIPATGTEDHLLVALHSADQAHWWKDGEHDIVVALTPLKPGVETGCLGGVLGELLKRE